jgi:hypothetical protein
MTRGRGIRGIRGIRVWDANPGSMAVSAALALSVAAGCVAQVQDKPATPAGADHRSASAPAPSSGQATPSPPGEAGERASPAALDERGMDVESRPVELGFDHSLQVRRSLTDVPRELRDGDSVMAKDRIRVHVRTSVDAYLYLAFCSRRSFTIYPSQGGIRTQAGAVTAAPEGDAELVIDNEPGTEVLYVILSARDIAVADPKLAAALAKKNPGNAPQDCGAALDASARPPSSGLAEAPPAPREQSAGTPKVIRGQQVPKRPMPSRSPSSEPRAGSSSDTTSSSASSAATKSPQSPGSKPSPPPDPDFVRHPGNIVWYDDGAIRGPGVSGEPQVTAADSDGIAVVRYTFPHVPAPRVPAPRVPAPR